MFTPPESTPPDILIAPPPVPPVQPGSLQSTVARLKRRLTLRERELAQLRRQLQTPELSQPDRGDAQAPSGLPSAYVALLNRIRTAVQQHTPANANIIVASKGDPELLKLRDQRSGSHFPRTEQGVYAGHHPAGSIGAIRHLEELRAAGGQFLLFPATAFWWFEYYSDFYQHLQKNYKLLLKDGESCALFDLRSSHSPSPSQPPTFKTQEYSLLLQQINQIVDALLPDNAVVAVVTRGDPGFLALPGRSGLHFPMEPSGAYAGHPANSAEAIALLARAREKGAQFLLFPWTAFWWFDHYREFADYLHTHCSLIVRRAQICALFEL